MRKAGVAINVAELKTELGQLHFEVDSDRTFRFHDLDGEPFTGTVKVASDGGVRLALDKRSLEWLSNKPKRADLVRWSAVSAFRVFRGGALVEGREVESEVLELYTDREVYRFIWH